MENNNLFKLADTFTFNNKSFCKFINSDGKIAFLNIDKDGKYYYPKIEDLVDIINKYDYDVNIFYAKDDKLTDKIFRFIPKAWVNGTLMLLTTTLLTTACSKTNNNSVSSSTPVPTQIESFETNDITPQPTTSPSISNEFDIKYETPINAGNISTREAVDINNLYDFNQSYTYTSASDVVTELPTYENIYNRLKKYSVDEIKNTKYKWKYETEVSSDLRFLVTQDHSVYKYIFGYDMPEKQAVLNTLDSNQNISDFYKGIIREWIEDWYAKYPGSDFTVFNENLKTLTVKELDKKELTRTTHSVGTIACYNDKPNAIYVNAAADKNSVQFKYTFMHELGHAAITFVALGEDTYNERIGVLRNTTSFKFLYGNEALVTYFSSDENQAELYRLIFNCYKIIITATGYNGADYLNHCPYELIAKIDASIGDLCDGEYLVSGIEKLGGWIYEPIEKASLNKDDVLQVVKTVIKIFLVNNPEATFEEVYDVLNYDLTEARDKYEELVGREVLEPLYNQAKEEIKSKAK